MTRPGRPGGDPANIVGMLAPAAVVRRAVEIGDPVLHLGVVVESAIAVRKAGRDPQLVPVVGAQDGDRMAPKCRRASTNVDRHVEDGTP